MKKNKSALYNPLAFTLVAAICLIFSSCASFYYSLAVARNDKAEVVAPAIHADQEESIFTMDQEWFINQPSVRLQMESRDGLTLAGYWLPNIDKSGTPSRNTVILAHGYSGRAIHMSPFAKTWFEDLGFNVLTVDARGHGDSEGDYIGFGWPERLDLIDWTGEVLKLAGPDCKIVYHGISMGGATVMMASGEPLPEQVVCIVEDCGYTSVWDELEYQMKHFRKVENPDGFLESTSSYTKKKAGYGFREASAINQVAKAEVPIMFIHGDSDTFVPTEMVYRLFDACPGKKEILIVKGAEHGQASAVAPETYTNKVTDFLRSCGMEF